MDANSWNDVKDLLPQDSGVMLHRTRRSDSPFFLGVQANPKNLISRHRAKVFPSPFRSTLPLTGHKAAEGPHSLFCNCASPLFKQLWQTSAIEKRHRRTTILPIVPTNSERRCQYGKSKRAEHQEAHLK
jgi:hypothetical protein